MILHFLVFMTVAQTPLTQDIDILGPQSFYELSQKIGVTAHELNTLNPSSPQYIKYHKKIRIPNKHIHIVEPDDTLNKILTRYHLTERAFYQFNPTFKTLSSHQWLALSPKGAALLFEPRQAISHNTAPRRTTSNIRHSPKIHYSPTLKASMQLPHRATSPFLSFHNHFKKHAQVSSGSTFNPSIYEHVKRRNLYTPGQCTYYAFERRNELGKPIDNIWGNANQ